MMRPYRKKPITIEAMQVTKEMLSAPQESFAFLDVPKDTVIWNDGWSYVAVRNSTGLNHAGPGDWIIRGLDGEIYVCPGDKFERTYEPA